MFVHHVEKKSLNGRETTLPRRNMVWCSTVQMSEIDTTRPDPDVSCACVNTRFILRPIYWLYRAKSMVKLVHKELPPGQSGVEESARNMVTNVWTHMKQGAIFFTVSWSPPPYVYSAWIQPGQTREYAQKEWRRSFCSLLFRGVMFIKELGTPSYSSLYFIIEYIIGLSVSRLGTGIK